jgi:hypothetical protein
LKKVKKKDVKRKKTVLGRGVNELDHEQKKPMEMT